MTAGSDGISGLKRLGKTVRAEGDNKNIGELRPDDGADRDGDVLGQGRRVGRRGY